MKFDYIVIAFGIFVGAVLALLGGQVPAMKAVPALLWLLCAILVFDLATAYIRGVPVVNSVSTATRLLAFCGGVAALTVTGGMW